MIGSGTDSAIYNAAGAEDLLAERKKIGNIKSGEAAVTPAFDFLQNTSFTQLVLLGKTASTVNAMFCVHATKNHLLWQRSYRQRA